MGQAHWIKPELKTHILPSQPLHLPKIQSRLSFSPSIRQRLGHLDIQVASINFFNSNSKLDLQLQHQTLYLSINDNNDDLITDSHFPISQIIKGSSSYASSRPLSCRLRSPASSIFGVRDLFRYLVKSTTRLFNHQTSHFQSRVPPSTSTITHPN